VYKRQEEEIAAVKRMRARKEAARRPSVLPPERRRGFELIEATLPEEAAQAEARRCLQCSTFCDKCVEVCPNRANLVYFVSPVRLVLPVLACRDGNLVVVGEEEFEVKQTRQILHVDDFCNECGNCATFCVHQGKPYAEKPRLFLREEDFRREEDNAFYLAGDTIRRREQGREARLSREDERLWYEDDRVRVGFGPDWSIVEMALKEPFSGTLSLKGAAEMAVILEGVRRSLPFLAGSG